MGILKTLETFFSSLVRPPLSDCLTTGLSSSRPTSILSALTLLVVVMNEVKIVGMIRSTRRQWDEVVETVCEWVPGPLRLKLVSISQSPLLHITVARAVWHKNSLTLQLTHSFLQIRDSAREADTDNLQRHETYEGGYI